MILEDMPISCNAMKDCKIILRSYDKQVQRKSVLGLDNWCPHISARFGKIAADAKIKLIFVPGGTTELAAPIDVGAGQFVKLYVTRCYEKWFEDNINEEVGL